MNKRRKTSRRLFFFFFFLLLLVQRQSPSQDTFTAARLRVGFGCTSSGTAAEPTSSFQTTCKYQDHVHNVFCLFVCLFVVVFLIFFSDIEMIKLSKNSHKFKVC